MQDQYIHAKTTSFALIYLKQKSISLPVHPFKQQIPSKFFKVIQKSKVFNFANTLQSLFRFYPFSAYIVSSSKFPKAALNRLCENFSILVYFILLDMKKFIFFCNIKPRNSFPLFFFFFWWRKSIRLLMPCHGKKGKTIFVTYIRKCRQTKHWWENINKYFKWLIHFGGFYQN